MTSKYILSNIPGFNDILNGYDVCNEFLKVVPMRSRNSDYSYKIIQYDKKQLSADLIDSYGLCRSIIVNENGQVVCFSPPKSTKTDLFFSQYHFPNEIVAEQFIEGTMINVFFNGDWEIATKSTIGATSMFYKGPNAKTFNDMFFEACRENGLIIENLDKEFCYSFVLQHPENRIVIPFIKPQLYLVAVYSIKKEEDEWIVYSHSPQEFRYIFNTLMNSSVKFPEQYVSSNHQELIDKYASMNTPYDVVGIVFHNHKTGQRQKFRNPIYEQVRQLRGNQSKIQYQYLCLRKEGKVGEFLKYYPEYKKSFSKFREQIHSFTNALFSNYIQCYIKKQKPLMEFPYEYRTHMFKIHQLYTNELREKQQFIKNTVVIDYVNQLHPSLLMYCLNYHMRNK